MSQDTQRRPFFARLLEDQGKEVTQTGPTTKKFPSDSDESETQKYPSDSDEHGV